MHIKHINNIPYISYWVEEILLFHEFKKKYNTPFSSNYFLETHISVYVHKVYNNICTHMYTIYIIIIYRTVLIITTICILFQMHSTINSFILKLSFLTSRHLVSLFQVAEIKDFYGVCWNAIEALSSPFCNAELFNGPIIQSRQYYTASRAMGWASFFLHRTTKIKT